MCASCVHALLPQARLYLVAGDAKALRREVKDALSSTTLPVPTTSSLPGASVDHTALSPPPTLQLSVPQRQALFLKVRWEVLVLVLVV